MKKAFLYLFSTILMMSACGSKQQQPAIRDIADDAISLQKNLPGDSALYGLACDGCTDSVLVFLPYSGGDPDTFDIINAFQQHHVYGRPRIGDELAVRRMVERMPDSLRQLMLTPREYSLRLKRDYTATARGSMRRRTTTDDMSPVEYPSIKRYTDWYFFNGKLILKADTIAGFSQEGDVPETDTVQIQLLTEDSLVLQFPTYTQGYYRKE